MEDLADGESRLGGSFRGVKTIKPGTNSGRCVYMHVKLISGLPKEIMQHSEWNYDPITSSRGKKYLVVQNIIIYVNDVYNLHVCTIVYHSILFHYYTCRLQAPIQGILY